MMRGLLTRRRRLSWVLLLLAVVLWVAGFVNVNKWNLAASDKARTKFQASDVLGFKYRALAETGTGERQTMESLMESVRDKLDQIQSRLNDSSVTLSSARLVRQGAEVGTGKSSGGCDVTEAELKAFPQCLGKLGTLYRDSALELYVSAAYGGLTGTAFAMWMHQQWRSDPCYAKLGVDGSLCSFIRYLNQVEGWCPGNGTSVENDKVTAPPNATIRMDKYGLMRLLADVNERESFSWVRMRVTRMWPRWTRAIQTLARKQDLANRQQKRILVHIGIMTNRSGSGFVERQFTGGPLGELVQWSDLISALYILGHKLTITSEAEQIPESLSQPALSNSSCKAWRPPPVDIVYTDIVGLGQLNQYIRESCVLRIVDSFGTEPAFNSRSYAEQHNKTTFWGGKNLIPQQFNTMFPHSPDNSFMGFVVDQYRDDVSSHELPKLNQALVYGKNAYMWSGRGDYIRVFNRSGLEVHGTVHIPESAPWPQEVPGYAINHGILKGKELHALLRRSKIFVGLGFPYEGPAALEAVAHGAVFINPTFREPRNRDNNAFFGGKPTDRKVYSQNDYLAQFVGEPFVYSIDIDDLEIVEKTVKTILDNKQISGFVPYEYTEEGMLQRMNAFIEHQDFCRPDSLGIWPPQSAVQVLLGDAGLECKEVCWRDGRICSPNHFKRINSKTVLKTHGAKCTTTDVASDIFFPAYNVTTSACILQREDLLFSCAGHQDQLQRLCPCRDFIKGQTALCIGCEV